MSVELKSDENAPTSERDDRRWDNLGQKTLINQWPSTRMVIPLGLEPRTP